MKNHFKRYKLTGSPREGDELLDRDNPAAIRKNLRWIQKKYEVTKNTQLKGVPSEDLVDWLYGKASDNISNIAGEPDSLFKGLIVKGARKLFKTVAKSFKNIFNNRKVKKALVVLGSMSVGIAIGAIIGTIVFPVIGTAVGGAIGGALAGVSAAVGAGIGLGVLGGVIGSKVGKKIDEVTPIDRSYYNVAPKIRALLNKNANLSNDESTRLNAYLTNRKNASKEPLVQKALSNIRSKVFKEGHVRGLESMSFYLVDELNILSELENKSPAQEKDILFLKRVLTKLADCPGMDMEVKENIQSTLRSRATLEPEPLELNSTREPIPRRHAIRFSTPLLQQEQLVELKAIGYKIEQAPILRQDAFKKVLKEHSKSMRKDHEHEYMQEKHSDTDNPGVRELHFFMSRINQADFNLKYQESTKKDGSHEVSITAESVGETDDYAPLAHAVTAFAKHYEERLPTNNIPKLIVCANRNEDIAAQLLAEAMKLKLPIVLNTQEFPQKEQQERIFQKANELSLKETPRSHFFKKRDATNPL